MTIAHTDLAGPVKELLGSTTPQLIGIAGPVSVGKTTIASVLGRALGAPVVTTDAFLLSNAVLAERDLSMRKGFPESYDVLAMMDVLSGFKAGKTVAVNVYSHEVYDLVGRTEAIDPGSIVIVEGVVALQSPVRSFLDVAIYIDAPEDIVRGWFIDRFLTLTRWAREHPHTFYHRFAELPSEQVRAIAEGAWDGINAVNLRDHIGPSKAHADLVVEKGSEHAILRVSSTG